MTNNHKSSLIFKPWRRAHLTCSDREQVCLNYPKVWFVMLEENNPGVSVHDGFPNPATDSSLQSLNLHSLLIKHPISTYFMRIAGNDWRDSGIFDSDIVLVDRALKPRPNDLVVWWEGEAFRLSPKHSVPIDTPTFGVITTTIHQHRKLQ